MRGGGGISGGCSASGQTGDVSDWCCCLLCVVQRRRHHEEEHRRVEEVDDQQQPAPPRVSGGECAFVLL